MPDARTIRQHVEARIAELEAVLQPLRAEYDQLKSVAASFTGADAEPGARRSAALRGRAARRRNAAAAAATPGGGSRAQQAIRLISATPGVTAADLASAMGISRNYLYRVLPKLEQEGVVTKHGQGYELASATAEG